MEVISTPKPKRLSLQIAANLLAFISVQFAHAHWIVLLILLTKAFLSRGVNGDSKDGDDSLLPESISSSELLFSRYHMTQCYRLICLVVNEGSLLIWWSCWHSSDRIEKLNQDCHFQPQNQGVEHNEPHLWISDARAMNSNSLDPNVAMTASLRSWTREAHCLASDEFSGKDDRAYLYINLFILMDEPKESVTISRETCLSGVIRKRSASELSWWRLTNALPSHATT